MRKDYTEEENSYPFFADGKKELICGNQMFNGKSEVKKYPGVDLASTFVDPAQHCMARDGRGRGSFNRNGQLCRRNITNAFQFMQQLDQFGPQAVGLEFCPPGDNGNPHHLEPVNTLDEVQALPEECQDGSGHAVVLVGYDTVGHDWEKAYFVVTSSWGTNFPGSYRGLYKVKMFNSASPLYGPAPNEMVDQAASTVFVDPESSTPNLPATPGFASETSYLPKRKEYEPASDMCYRDAYDFQTTWTAKPEAERMLFDTIQRICYDGSSPDAPTFPLPPPPSPPPAPPPPECKDCWGGTRGPCKEKANGVRHLPTCALLTLCLAHEPPSPCCSGVLRKDRRRVPSRHLPLLGCGSTTNLTKFDRLAARSESNARR